MRDGPEKAGGAASLESRVVAALDASADATGPALLTLLRQRHADDPELLAELEALLGNKAKVPVLDETLAMDACPPDGSTAAEAASASRLRSAVFRAARSVAQRGGVGLGEGGDLSASLLGSEETPEPMPSSIGPFRVLRELGRGGMGVVYECEQQEPRRRVAVKVLRVGLGWGSGRQSASLAMDSRREAAVLAKLAHPGIVRVIEAGVDAGSGRTYFAMDLVEGRTLLRHARELGLGVLERVELLARVCDAVDHAHRKGIIHRDIKPSNILVEGAGETGGAGPSGEFARVGQPRVMDFGVAKLTDPLGEGAVAQSILLPGSSSIVGTLGYISPEALAGDAHGVDTRADVYALGVVLFELLAGEAPIALAGVPLSEVARRVMEARVPALREYDARLKGDLETIARKALAKEPGQRYGAAGELGDDLRRFLRREPVVAQPASAMYLARKFVARHRVVSGLGAGLILALVAGLATTLVMITRVERAREQERVQREIAGAIRGYLVQDLIGAASPDRAGKDAKIIDVLRDLTANVGTRFPGQPELEGRVRHELASVLHGLGLLQESLEQAEAAQRILEPLLGGQDLVVVSALAAQATVLQSMGDGARAEPLAREGLARARAGLAPMHPTTFRLSAVLGGSLHAQRKVEEAIGVLEPLLRDVDLYEGIEESDRAAARLQYAAALQQAKPPRLDDAAEQLRLVIEAYDRAGNRASPAALAARNNLVVVLTWAKRYEDALVILETLPDLVASTFPPEHPAHGYTAMTKARTLSRLGRNEEALEWANRAVEALTRAFGDSDWQTERAMGLAGQVGAMVSGPEEARRLALRAVAARMRTASRDELATTVKTLEEWGKVLGVPREDVLAMLVARMDEFTPVGHARRVRMLANLAWASVQVGRVEEAVRLRAMVEPTNGSLVGDAGDGATLEALDQAIEQALVESRGG